MAEQNLAVEIGKLNEKYNAQEEKINSCETRLGRMETKTDDINSNLIKNTTITERLDDTIRSFNCTMQGVEKAMVGIDINMTNMNNDIDSLNGSVSHLKNRIEEVDDKYKLDVGEIQTNKAKNWLKENSGWISVGGILGLLEILNILGVFPTP